MMNHPRAKGYCAGLSLALLAGCATPPAPSTSSIMAPAPSSAAIAALPDAVPKIEPIKPSGPNKPYTVLGQAYEPLTADLPWKQQGLASWYGPSFHGHKTASGELYDMYGMSAAHPTLPIPSYIKVRNLSNGREVIVRVNDRGPFHAKRILDLSYAAASKLGIVATGTGHVEIQRLTFDDIRTGSWRDGQAALARTKPASLDVTPSPQALALAAPTAGLSPSVPAPQDAASAVQAGTASPVSQEVDVSSAATETPTTAPTPAPTPAAAPALSSEAELSAPVPDAQRARAYTSGAQGYWVQLGAFARSDGAHTCHERAVSGLSWLAPLLTVFHESSLFRVQAGPYRTREQASTVALRIREALSMAPMIVERR